MSGENWATIGVYIHRCRSIKMTSVTIGQCLISTRRPATEMNKQSVQISSGQGNASCSTDFASPPPPTTHATPDYIRVKAWHVVAPPPSRLVAGVKVAEGLPSGVEITGGSGPMSRNTGFEPNFCQPLRILLANPIRNTMQFHASLPNPKDATSLEFKSRRFRRWPRGLRSLARSATRFEIVRPVEWRGIHHFCLTRVTLMPTYHN